MFVELEDWKCNKPKKLKVLGNVLNEGGVNARGMGRFENATTEERLNVY